MEPPEYILVISVKNIWRFKIMYCSLTLKMLQVSIHFFIYNWIFQIKYIDEIQMSFMRMLYSKVTQKFTYFCINSVGYEEQQSGTKDYALDFMGENEYEWEGPKMKSKAVPFDGCKVIVSVYLVFVSSYTVNCRFAPLQSIYVISLYLWVCQIRR